MNKSCTEDNQSRGILKVHFFYITFLLVAVIVVLATRNWTKLEGFTDYLNVAATISSLLLAILAIIYSFVSSGTQSQFLGAIQSSASEIGSISSEMKAVVAEGQGLQNRAELRTEQLQGLVDELRAAISDVSARTTEIAGAVSTLPNKFGELRELLNERKVPAAVIGTKINWSNEDLSTFLMGCSITGFATLRGGMLAHEKGTYIELNKVVGESNIDYVWGFVVACIAANICTFEYPGKSNNVKAAKGQIRLDKPSEQLSKAIRDEWARRGKVEGPQHKEMVTKYGPLIDDSFI